MQQTFLSKKQLIFFLALVLVLGGVSVVRRQSLFSGGVFDQVVENVAPLSKMTTEQNANLDIAEYDIAKPSMGISAPSIDYWPGPVYPRDHALDEVDRVYRKSADYSLVANDVTAYMRGMREFILSIDGRVLSSSQNKSGRYDSGYLYVMVPVDKFEEATGRVTADVQDVYHESVSATDETGRKVAADDRVKDLEEQKLQKEIELLEAVSEAQKKKIQLEITRIEQQLESARQQQGQVDETIEYSSITISVASSARYYNPEAEIDLRGEFQEALRSVKMVGVLLVYVLIWAGMYAVLLLPPIIIIKLLLRRRKKSSESESSESV